MNTTPTTYLRGLYSNRKERNPAYSMSAFARDLGISVSLLSRIFNNSRPLSLKLGLQISATLGLSDTETNSFILSILEHSSENAKISRKLRQQLQHELKETRVTDESSPFFSSVEIERFKTMAQWHHLAILNLTTLDQFRSDASWIAKQIGITPAEASEAIDRLVALGLLEEQGDVLKRAQKNFYVKTQRSEFAIRKFHEQMIGKAQQELQKTSDQDFQRRLITGITFSCGDEHIEAIKDKIDRLQDEIIAMVPQGEQKHVYQWNSQFFPLTQTSTPSKTGETQ